VRIKREERAEDGDRGVVHKIPSIEEERTLREEAESSKKVWMRIAANACDDRTEAERRMKKVIKQRDRERARCIRIEDELENWKVVSGVLAVTLLMLGIVVFLLAGVQVGFVTAG